MTGVGMTEGTAMTVSIEITPDGRMENLSRHPYATVKQRKWHMQRLADDSRKP